MSAQKKIDMALELADTAHDQAVRSTDITLRLLRSIQRGEVLTGLDECPALIDQLEKEKTALLASQGIVQMVRNQATVQ